MIGKYTLEVSYKKVKYKIEINRSVTVIKGDSGTGKSTLVGLVDKAIQPNSLIKCNLRERIYALNNNSDWEYLLTKLKNKIIFIDESCYFINRKEFVELAQSSDNYFVLITRLNLSNWVYSYKSIYELETIGKEHSYETVLKYKFKSNIGNSSNKIQDTFICEDSNSGYEMFCNIIHKNKIVSAFGKDKIYSLISKDKSYYIVADGAGFGNCIEKIANKIHDGYKVTLNLPESFEYMLLNIPKLRNIVSDELTNTYMYCDSKRFKSYERYYTYLLDCVINKLYNKKYSKHRLLSELNTDRIIEEIKGQLKMIDKSLLR